MTPMFPEGENNRLCAHAARAEPVYKSSSSVAVLGPSPEAIALYRRASAGAVSLPAACRATAAEHNARRAIAANRRASSLDRH